MAAANDFAQRNCSYLSLDRRANGSRGIGRKEHARRGCRGGIMVSEFASLRHRTVDNKCQTSTRASPVHCRRPVVNPSGLAGSLRPRTFREGGQTVPSLRRDPYCRRHRIRHHGDRCSCGDRRNGGGQVGLISRMQTQMCLLLLLLLGINCSLGLYRSRIRSPIERFRLRGQQRCCSSSQEC